MDTRGEGSMSGSSAALRGSSNSMSSGCSGIGFSAAGTGSGGGEAGSAALWEATAFVDDFREMSDVYTDEDPESESADIEADLEEAYTVTDAVVVFRAEKPNSVNAADFE